jgi:hypothetical protein
MNRFRNLQNTIDINGTKKDVQGIIKEIKRLLYKFEIKEEEFPTLGRVSSSLFRQIEIGRGCKKSKIEEKKQYLLKLVLQCYLESKVIREVKEGNISISALKDCLQRLPKYKKL